MASKKKSTLTDQEELDLIIEPNKNLLDDEWVYQPRLFRHWAEKLEDAKAEIDDAKREFDVIKAEFEEVKASLDLDIRRDPDKYDLPKVTDKSVPIVMLLQTRYKKTQQALFNAQRVIDTAKHKAGILQAVVKSLEQRKSSLEKLVDRHGQKYFATPRASEHSREMVDEIEKRSTRRKSKVKNRR